MTADVDPSRFYEQIDEILRAWRQGDCVLGEHWFVHRIDPSVALTAASHDAVDSGVDLVETPVAGLVVVTQTCDVVRSCRDRPYLEVCPLVEADQDLLGSVQASGRPGYAFLPLLAGHGLVADLDRVMTIEKSVAARWQRVPGLTTDDDVRRLQRALARKRERFAFPDDFVQFAAPLHQRIKKKHGRNSDEGDALRALREIRVQASPSWGSNRINLMFFFIRHDDSLNFENRSWEDYRLTWMGLIPASGRFVSVDGQVEDLGRLSAKDYVSSDPLDLERLSEN